MMFFRLYFIIFLSRHVVGDASCKCRDLDKCSMNMIIEQMDRIEKNYDSVKSLMEYQKQELSQLKDDLKRLYCPTTLPASCKAVRQANNLNPSGEYTLANNGQNFTAYCSFEGSVGYTYISRLSYGANIDLSQLYSFRNSTKIRIRWSDGKQKEVLVQNLPSYGSPDLYFGRNTFTGYRSPQNKAMEPYLYLGFLPISRVMNKNRQGYQAAGKDFTFQNCDANTNNYMVFYFNPSNLYPAKRGWANRFMTGWMDYSTSLPSSKYMSTDYYFDWEMHMGGCGGFMTSHAVSNTKAALGLPFTIHPCDGLNCQNGGKCIVSGLTGSCSCPRGYFGSKCESHGCTKGWFQYNSKCYYISKDRKTWDEAKESCEQMKAILVEINNEKTGAFLKKTINLLNGDRSNYFTGGTDAEKHGHYVWQHSGKSLSFTDWGHNQPGDEQEHCIALASYDSYRFHDYPCDRKMGHICEKTLV